VAIYEIEPVNGGNQESEQRKKVMYCRSPLFVKDAPDEHEADEYSCGPLLSEKMAYHK
jgi:hypothetical protein